MTRLPDFETLDEITRRLAESVPDGLRSAGEDLQGRFRQVLTGAFERMELVTREEFEIQQQVLRRTREKLDTLQQRLDELESTKT